MTPAAGRTTVNGASHLGRARGQRHGSIALNVSRVLPPIESAILCQSGPHSLGFPHQVFIYDLMNRIAEESRPMGPEPVVRRIVASHLLEVIAKGIGLAEYRAIQGEATV